MNRFLKTSIIFICNFGFLLPCFATEYQKGLDISTWQGSINFEDVAKSGYTCLYIRAGEGENTVDERFFENIKGTQSQNLPYGCYYYVTAKNSTESKTQAEAFGKLIENLDYSLPPAMDFEEFSGISVEESNEIALVFLETLESLTKVTPVIYTDAYNVEQRWSDQLGDYPLWVADYAHLANPEDYKISDNSPWSHWSGYQYSDSGEVSGISGSVDCNLFHKDLFLTDSTTEVKAESTKLSFLDYSVKAGDTLWRISQHYHVSLENILEYNDISDQNLIYPGEKIEIPMKSEVQVKTGDTLSLVAELYDTTVSILAQVNEIQNINLIYVGEVLFIP